jgi:pteridine reductase
MTTTFDHAHPVVLVTGAGSPRIGNCVVETLAGRGYRLVIHANASLDGAQKSAQQICAAGGQAIAVQADLTQEIEVDSMIQRIDSEFSRLDGVVHCAAIWPFEKLEQTHAEEMESAWRANTLATFLVCRYAGLAMVDQPTGGAIVTIGDWAVVRPYLDCAAYFSAKGANTTLTRTMAVELAAKNPRIRVNEIRPGPVMLPADMPDDERQEAINATLVKHEGSPQNVADAAVLLLENDFITGVTLPVDGGRSIYAPN